MGKLHLTEKDIARRIEMGRAVRFYREQRDLTQQELAQKVGVSIASARTWERTTRKPLAHMPRGDTAVKLANALGVSLAKLRIGTTTAPPDDALLAAILVLDHMADANERLGFDEVAKPLRVVSEWLTTQRAATAEAQAE